MQKSENPPAKGHKLGLLWAASPDGQQLSQITHLAREAISRGSRVFVYLVDDGVSVVTSEEIQRLRRDGVHVFCCAFGARKRGIPWDDKATFGGLTILADMLSNCDSFVAYTPLQISTTNYETKKASQHTLIIISTDPARSHLPAEAIRVAAGLQPWMDHPVDILLDGPSTKILGPDSAEYVDGKNFADHLKIIRAWDHPVYLAPSAEGFTAVDGWERRIKKLKPKGVEELKLQARNVIWF
jgi:hypothetical protein